MVSNFKKWKQGKDLGCDMQTLCHGLNDGHFSLICVITDQCITLKQFYKPPAKPLFPIRRRTRLSDIDHCVNSAPKRKCVHGDGGFLSSCRKCLRGDGGLLSSCRKCVRGDGGLLSSCRKCARGDGGLLSSCR
jgi:hypothetical protein